MVKLYKGISINGFQSLSQDSSSYFNRELLVTDKARSISKHKVLLKVFFYHFIKMLRRYQ